MKKHLIFFRPDDGVEGGENNPPAITKAPETRGQPHPSDYVPSGGLGNLLKDYLPGNGNEGGDENSPKPTEGDPPPVDDVNKTKPDTTPPSTLTLEEVQAELKKHQTLSEERGIKLEQTEKELKALKEAQPIDPDVIKFIEKLRTDPLGALKEYEKKFELPPVDLIKSTVTAGGDIKSRLKVYQSTVAKKTVEKEFDLDEGTFRYDADEAEDPSSASYRFRELSRNYEETLRNEARQLQDAEKKVIEDVQKTQAADLKWYADTYLGGDETKAGEALASLNRMPIEISEGKLPMEKHPFGLRTILLGVNHETLQEQAVKTAVEALHAEYNAKGMYLPDGDTPPDITKIPKAGSIPPKVKPKTTGIPTHDLINRYAESN